MDRFDNSGTPFTIGCVLFKGFTWLDVAGPCEVLARMPSTTVFFIAQNPLPVVTDFGVAIVPQYSFEDAPHFNMLLVPGGPGQIEVMENENYISFIRERGLKADYVTSVCTGALLLGAAGLLQGYQATTHWRYLDLLELLGAIPVSERVVIDRNRITGAGVSAGIDFAITIASLLFGETIATQIQLGIEYDPLPPFKAGSPGSASSAVVETVNTQLRSMYQKRREQIERLNK